MDWTSYAALLDAPRSARRLPEISEPVDPPRYTRDDPPVRPKRPRYGNLPPLGELPAGASGTGRPEREAAFVALYGLAAMGLERSR